VQRLDLCVLPWFDFAASALTEDRFLAPVMLQQPCLAAQLSDLRRALNHARIVLDIAGIPKPYMLADWYKGGVLHLRPCMSGMCEGRDGLDLLCVASFARSNARACGHLATPTLRLPRFASVAAMCRLTFDMRGSWRP
jgi:hypothetical protein